MQATNRTAGDASIRAIDERNAFVMTSLLQRVAEFGTARRAVRELKRHDIAGKTGTSNDSQDAWFCGFAGSPAAVGWMGYDTPKPLGSRETGGGLVLPIWIDYMRIALKKEPETLRVQPDSVVERDGLYFYRDPVQGGPGEFGTTPDTAVQDLVRDQIF